MGQPFLGVDLDNIGKETTEAPDSAPDKDLEVPGQETTEATEAAEAKAQAIFDLDKASKVRFEGKEWTQDELKAAFMRQQDYTRKTTELSEARKYADNFEADFAKVQKDPSLLAELKSVYPKFYADLADRLLKLGGHAKEREVANPESNDPRDDEFKNLKSQVEELVGEKKALEIEKIGSWLNTQFEANSKKFPSVGSDPFLNEVVTARLQAISDTGAKVDEKVIEKVFKQVSDMVEKTLDTRTKAVVAKQVEANKKGKDIGTGGGAPGQAPYKPKKLSDVKNQWLADLEARKQ